MGYLDRYEQHPAYRWAWDRDWCGRRPWTHTARAWCRRHQLAYGCLCVAAGSLVAGGPCWTGPVVFVLSIVLGHLFV
jgi:hypothetical protein